VTYAECTLGNHVYYGHYLEFLEAARGELFRQLGTTFQQWQEQDTIFPVVECHLRYKAPARYDDVLAIDVWPDEVKGPRLNFGYRILKPDGKLVLEAETHHVCTGLNEKPKRVPEELAERLETLIT
jgi:acyl-CoA thioester hydrolase